ncbi:MAG: PA2169 family four-helix-bundle protein [Clostridia bacterium]|nr:PA2169 family four-helix-bundle protein [Clostridia bacterium]
MENTAVNELNAFLKGEIMAVEAYQNYIDGTQEQRIKDEFLRIQKDHKKHMEIISDRIKALGGEPEKGTGFAGIMSNTKLKLENVMGRNPFDTLKDAYDGEDKGVAKAEEIVKGDLDPESRGLIQGILKQDHEHLSRMAHLIADYEIKH